MEFNANRVDEANAVVSATVTKEVIEANLDKVAKQASKTMNIQGFRKGKVPVAVVKQRFAEKLTEDAEGEAIRKVLADGLKRWIKYNNTVRLISKKIKGSAYFMKELIVKLEVKKNQAVTEACFENRF